MAWIIGIAVVVGLVVIVGSLFVRGRTEEPSPGMQRAVESGPAPPVDPGRPIPGSRPDRESKGA
jgi:hypothetical protein